MSLNPIVQLTIKAYPKYVLMAMQEIHSLTSLI